METTYKSKELAWLLKSVAARVPGCEMAENWVWVTLPGASLDGKRAQNRQRYVKPAIETLKAKAAAKKFKRSTLVCMDIYSSATDNTDVVLILVNV